MRTLIKNPSQIITVDTEGKNFKRGKNLGGISPLYDHSIIIEDEIIKDFVKSENISELNYDDIIDASNKVVTPGLVECHTHTAYAGSRAEEFRLRLGGKSYEEIAEAGGGINATVQAVRKSSFDELVSLVQPRINYFISHGITTLEIKSGYGLSYYDEIKLLQVINHLNKTSAIDIVPTFLGAHTFPPEYRNDHQQYIDVITEELIPYIAKNKLAYFCDAFCEQTAFSADETELIFIRALEHGLKLKLHTEQFNNIGGLQTALKNNAVSVDHLEVLLENDIDALSKSETTAVLLPGVSFFLDYDFAPARKLIENDAIVALATDYNPGSSHISNLSFIMSLAALKMGMTIDETISAVTINAAKALDMSSSIGSLEIGKKADFAIFDTSEYSDIVYNVGKNLNCMTIKNGKVIYKN